MSQINSYEVHQELKDAKVFRGKGLSSLSQHSHFCRYLVRRKIITNLADHRVVKIGSERTSGAATKAYILNDKEIFAIKHAFSIPQQKNILQPTEDSVVSDKNTPDIALALTKIADSITALTSFMQEQMKFNAYVQQELDKKEYPLPVPDDKKLPLLESSQTKKEYKWVTKEYLRNLGVRINKAVTKLYLPMMLKRFTPEDRATMGLCYEKAHSEAQKDYLIHTKNFYPGADAADPDQKKDYCTWLEGKLQEQITAQSEESRVYA